MRPLLIAALCLVACGQIPALEHGKPEDSTTKTTASSDVTDTTGTDTTDATNPVNGKWLGGWVHRFQPAAGAFNVGDYCWIDGDANPRYRTITLSGTLTIDGETATFAGSVTDFAAVVRLGQTSQKYCKQETTSYVVSQSLTVTVSGDTVTLACADLDDCGAGLGDWRVGPADTVAAITAVLGDSLSDPDNTVHRSFEFWKE